MNECMSERSHIATRGSAIHSSGSFTIQWISRILWLRLNVRLTDPGAFLKSCGLMPGGVSNEYLCNIVFEAPIYE